MTLAPAAPRPTKDAVVKAADIELAPRISGARAFEIVARACLAHSDANEPLLHVDGPHEALHQFRVGYRRLRSLFSLCREVHWADEDALRIKLALRVLTQTFGPARDLDVFREGHPDLPPEGAARLESARQQAYAAALGHLHSPEWRQVRAELDAWLDARRYRQVLPTATWSARVVAARAMERRRDRIITHGADLAAISAHERHRVRIECKKVRYGAQFFGGLWPARSASVKRHEQLLSEIQDRLGVLNDVATWTHIEDRLDLVVERAAADEAAEIAAAQDLVWQVAQEQPFWRRDYRPPRRPPAWASVGVSGPSSASLPDSVAGSVAVSAEGPAAGAVPAWEHDSVSGSADEAP